MKKVLFLAALISLSMMSCVKDYSCNCTTTQANGSTSTASYPISTNKKSAAVDACESMEGGNMGTETEVCTLK